MQETIVVDQPRPAPELATILLDRSEYTLGFAVKLLKIGTEEGPMDLSDLSETSLRALIHDFAYAFGREALWLEDLAEKIRGNQDQRQVANS